ncbi:hypothetical protein [Mesorhizobium huakuii]|uniref:hypothetical protein n=1 Tax=Mesorhizobium huakuii TaxID=28104 RepID=UPI001FD5812A|nr:hypothetical protein [Mesorhizobium huakuii]
MTELDFGSLQARTSAPEKGGGGWDLLIANRWPFAAPFYLLDIGDGKSIGLSNKSYWTNSKFDELLSEIKGTVDLKKSQKLVDQAARLIYTEAPYIILSYPYLVDARRKDCFKGWGTQDIVSMNGYFPMDRLEPM